MREDSYTKCFVFGVLILLCMSGTLTTAIDVNETRSSKIDPEGQIALEGRDHEDWWHGDWNYRKKVVIDHTMVDNTLFNFPILFDNTSADFSHAQNDGDDFVFVAYDNTTVYNHEIDSYNAGTNRLIAWVNINSLPSGEDTILWLYYGNSGCASQENPIGVWDSNYVGVWHLNDNTTSDTLDSTSYGNVGNKKGANEPIEVAGKIVNAQGYDGSDDYVDCGNDVSLQITDAISLEAWIKAEVIQEELASGIVTKDYTGSSNRAYNLHLSSATAPNPWALRLRLDGVGLVNGTTDLRDDTWHYVVGTWDGTLRVYVDSVEENSSVAAGSITNAAVNVRIGDFVSDKLRFNGSIDEVRISKIVRDGSWINATYRTTNSPTAFLTVGGEEELIVIQVSNPYPPDGAVDVEFTPTMNITVNHIKGDQMDITWRWNNSGIWDVFGTNMSIYNGTYHQVNANFSTMGITYEWRVEVTDGVGNWTNETYSFTIFGETIPPIVEIAQPLKSFLYFSNIRLIPFFTTLVIGAIDVIADVSDTSAIDRVEFYLEGDLKNISTSAPYTWEWYDRMDLFPYIIKVVAYDEWGNSAEASLRLWKVF